MPNTVSIFSGQHSWYDIDPDNSDIPCIKCHTDVKDEMDESGVHKVFNCVWCHRSPFSNQTFASGGEPGFDPGENTHATVLLECMACHDAIGDVGRNHWNDPEYRSPNCYDCHNDNWTTSSGFNPPYFSAGGFGITGWGEDTGIKAAHKQFVQNATGSILMEGENEACIGCHTNAPVSITFNASHRYEIELNRACEWEVGDFSEGDYSEVVV